MSEDGLDLERAREVGKRCASRSIGTQYTSKAQALSILEMELHRMPKRAEMNALYDAYDEQRREMKKDQPWTHRNPFSH